MIINILKRLVLTSILMVLVACGSMSDSPTYDGVYYHEGDSAHYLSLKANGKFELLERGNFIVGYYKVRARVLHLYKDSRCFSEGMIMNGYIIDPDKTKWVKSESVNEKT